MTNDDAAINKALAAISGELARDRGAALMAMSEGIDFAVALLNGGDLAGALEAAARLIRARGRLLDRAEDRLARAAMPGKRPGRFHRKARRYFAPTREAIKAEDAALAEEAGALFEGLRRLAMVRWPGEMGTSGRRRGLSMVVHRETDGPAAW